jgi:hypothetical protein
MTERMVEADFGALRAAVRSILEHPQGRDWTVQGFGMMRTYFGKDKQYRLNIWNSALAVRGVSIIHDHPWDFRSWIIGGQFTNVRYEDVTGTDNPLLSLAPAANGESGIYNYMEIKTGEGGGKTGEVYKMTLLARPQEFYGPGATYEQKAEEIHASFYHDGTVTLNDRRRVGTGEHAHVFWPYGQKWVDAEPRKAKPAEVKSTLALALAQINAQG